MGSQSFWQQGPAVDADASLPGDLLKAACNNMMPTQQLTAHSTSSFVIHTRTAVLHGGTSTKTQGASGIHAEHWASKFLAHNLQHLLMSCCSVYMYTMTGVAQSNI